MARKNKYETHVLPQLNRIPSWRKQGLTEKQIGKRLGIVESTLYVYKNKYSEFAEALKIGQEELIEQLEETLYKRAMGYEYEEKKEYIEDRDGVKIKKIEKTSKYLAPDVGALAFALKNLKTDHWKDRHKTELDIIEQQKQIEKLQAEIDKLRGDNIETEDLDDVIGDIYGSEETQEDNTI